MIKLSKHIASILLVFGVVMNLSGCSALSKIRGALGNKASVDYQNNQSVKRLEIPPDLTQPEFDDAFAIPSGNVVSAVAVNNGGSAPADAYAGGSSSTVNKSASGARRGNLATVRTVSGQSVLQINDTYARSLVLTEIILGRMGFSVVSKSPTSGEITATYNGSDVYVAGKRKSLWGRAKGLVGLGSNESNEALGRTKTYRFTVGMQDGVPIVRVARVSGTPLSDAAYAKIISLMNDAFNR